MDDTLRLASCDFRVEFAGLCCILHSYVFPDVSNNRRRYSGDVLCVSASRYVR